MSQLLLWDVDHTLIENSGISKAIYSSAFSRLASRPPINPPITAGMTDRLIMRKMFISESVPDPGWPRTDHALQAAGAELQPKLREVGYVLPGVREVLKQIHTQAEVIQSVVTGNIAQNATIKLAAFALEGFFDIAAGAYGGDSEDRHDLVRLARARAERLYDAVFDESNTTVIGDTPRDVEAARQGGARIVAVATGVDSESELRAAGANVILRDLSDIDHAVSVILGR